jgi:Flp pilus assembly protein TadD
MVCWLQATAPDDVRFDLSRQPDRPGPMTPLRGAFGPTQAMTLAGLLERRGWRDVRIIRRRLNDPRPLREHETIDPDLPLRTRPVRLGKVQLLGTEVPPTASVAAARRGARLAQNGDWPAAREALRAAVEADPTSPTLWRSYGTVLGRCGEWRFCRRALERAIELGDEASRQLLGEVRQIESLARVTQRRAWDAGSHRQLGLLLMSWERGDEALTHLERAVQLAPRDLTCRMALGLELLCRTRWADAAACYTAALDLAGDESRAAAEQGLALAQAGRLPEMETGGDDVWAELLAAG